MYNNPLFSIVSVAHMTKPWYKCKCKYNLTFSVSWYIIYKNHKLPRLLADWTDGVKCPLYISTQVRFLDADLWFHMNNPLFSVVSAAHMTTLISTLRCGSRIQTCWTCRWWAAIVAPTSINFPGSSSPCTEHSSWDSTPTGTRIFRASRETITLWMLVSSFLYTITINPSMPKAHKTINPSMPKAHNTINLSMLLAHICGLSFIVSKYMIQKRYFKNV